MKMNRKLIIFVVGILFLSSLGSTITIGQQTKQIIINDGPNSITIENNGDFRNSNYVDNPNAQGNFDDPYIIKGKTVDYILISNTDKYFKIENCNINVKGIGIALTNVENGIINNIDFNNIETGIDIFLAESKNNEIYDCEVRYTNSQTFYFFVGYKSNSNKIHHCELTKTRGEFSGIFLSESNNNEIYNCKISKAESAIALEKSDNNKVYYNDFIKNDIHAEILSGSNFWDDGVSKGNFWDDYKGSDFDNDGSGNSPYIIDSNNKDRYPKMSSSGKSQNLINNLFENLANRFPIIFRFYNLFSYKKILLNEIEPLKTLNTKVEETSDNSQAKFTTLSYGDGWLEERDGVKILHIGGSYYDMGFQHGKLLKDTIKINLRAQLSNFEQRGWTYAKILNKYHEMKDKIPDKYIDEMEGMADGSGLPYDDIAVLNTIPAVFNHPDGHSCCEVALWGSASKNGALYHIRSWDWTLKIKDPNTGTYFQETQILMVRDPDEGYASMYPDFAGHVICWAGFNEEGIVLGETTVHTTDYDFDGISAAFRMRMVMDEASSDSEALEIMSNNRTCGWNFVISDAKIPKGYAMEQTANQLYIGEWNDPIEGNEPFKQITNVIRRVPSLYLHPSLAATQPGRTNYDPSGIKGFLNYLLQIDGTFAIWYFYKEIGEEIKNNYGKLGLEETTNLIRNIHAGKTDLLFRIIMNIGLVHPIHTWVGNPRSGDISVAFASSDKHAYENPVHYFNFYDLLNSSPP